MIPTLLLRGAGLVKTTNFAKPKYVGDPINAIKIFNDKEVDELVLLDISATREGKGPAYEVVESIASECFMSVAYGGGIRTIEEMRRILNTGVEKIIINSAAIHDPSVIEAAAREFGSQAVIVSVDVKRNFLGHYKVFSSSGSKTTKLDPVAWSKHAQERGAGEILLTSIDRDGTMKGYDTNLISAVSKSVNIPVIASGGAGSLTDFSKAVKDGGASAVAAGAMFVFHGPHRAVLITYPNREELEAVFA